MGCLKFSTCFAVKLVWSVRGPAPQMNLPIISRGNGNANGLPGLTGSAGKRQEQNDVQRDDHDGPVRSQEHVKLD